MSMMCYYCDSGTVARYLSVYLLITQYTDSCIVNINIGNIQLIRTAAAQPSQVQKNCSQNGIFPWRVDQADLKCSLDVVLLYNPYPCYIVDVKIVSKHFLNRTLKFLQLSYKVTFLKVCRKF